MHFRTRLIAAATLALAATASMAGVVSTSTRLGNWSVASPAAVFVPLNDGNATSVKFSVASERKVVITYSAECAVDAPADNNSAWLEITILIDGVPLRPTAGTSDAFCSADGKPGFNNWVRPSVTGYLLVGAGMAFLGITPRGLFDSLTRFVGSITNLGFDAVKDAGGWLLAGALVVIPVWLLLRMTGSRR